MQPSDESEPSKSAQELSKLLAKFLEDADKPNTIAEAVKDFVLALKEEAEEHNAMADSNERNSHAAEPAIDSVGTSRNDCIGWHVMRILKRATNKSDPLFEDMDMITRMQIQTGATTAMHMVK